MQGLLISEILFFLWLIFISIKALTKYEFMFFLFSIFTAFYLMIRPILLLSENYINFAVINKHITTFNHQALFYEFLYIVVVYFIVYILYTSIKVNVKSNYKIYNKFDLAKIVMALFASFIVVFISPMAGLPYLTYLYLFYSIQNKHSKILLIILFIFLIFFYTFSIDRRDWLFLILSILFVYFAVSKNVKVLKVFFVGSISFFLLIYILLAFRTDGLFNFEAVYNRLSGNTLVMGIFEIEADFPIVSDDITILFENLVVNNKSDYLYGIPFLKPLYSFIPRNIWEDKPLSVSTQFAKQFNPSFYLGGGSEPITIYGELFWNFGIFSLIVFMIFAYYYKYLDLHMKKFIIEKNHDKLALYSVYIALNFHLLRGPIDNFWLIFLYLYLLTILEKNLRIILKSIIKNKKFVLKNISKMEKIR